MVNFPAAIPVQQFACPPSKLLASPNEVNPRRSSEVDRACRVQPLRIRRGYGSARRAEQRQSAPDGKAGQAGVERGLADAVVHGRDVVAIGELTDLCAELCRVIGIGEHPDRARLAGEFGFGGGGGRGDDVSPHAGSPLRQDQTHAACTGVQQHRIIRLHGVYRFDQQVCGHALQQCGSCDIISDIIG